MNIVRFEKIIKRTKNEHLYAYLEAIGNAMKRKKKIAIRYHTFRSGFKEHIVSPYYLVISSGMYYLLCNKDGKEDIGHFRLDRITGIKILEDIQRPISKLQVYNVGRPRDSVSGSKYHKRS